MNEEKEQEKPKNRSKFSPQCSLFIYVYMHISSCLHDVINRALSKYSYLLQTLICKRNEDKINIERVKRGKRSRRKC